jgi:hypothetical protein
MRQPNPRQRLPRPSQGQFAHDDDQAVTATSRHPALAFPRRASGQLDVSLDVPNLDHAVAFYSKLFDTAPSATERRLTWFDVPQSPLQIELRQATTPTATRLRLCIEPHRLQEVAQRLSQNGVAIAQAGLTNDGNPQAIRFRDTGHNSWELYAPIISTPAPPPIRHRARRCWRWLVVSVRAGLAPGPLEERLRQERNRTDILLARHGYPATTSQRSRSSGRPRP